MNQRAVYYARISTDSDEQQESFPKQCRDLEDCIKNNGWEITDSFRDEGKSGTSIKKRDEYNRLFDSISKDEWDILVIKSQDRLMRNVRDWYTFISEILAYNKKLFIYMDNAFYKSDDSFLAGIKAILAEEYSRDLSRKLNNAHKRRETEGSSIMSNNRIWGYTKLNGELVIDENEANIVRRIYDMYVYEKRGVREIINQLEIEGITTKQGKKFGATTISKILKSERYIGTLICNQQHKVFDTKKIVKNPKSDWIIHENRIPQIITKETFEKAQQIRKSRSQIYNPSGSKTGKRESRHPLGGKIYCGKCGKLMWYNAVKKTSKSGGYTGYRYPWICSTYSQLGRLGQGKFPEEGCNKLNVNDQYLTDEINKLINNLNVDKNKNELISTYIKKAEESMSLNKEKLFINKVVTNIKEIENKQSLLVDKFLDGVIQEDVYKRKNSELVDILNKHKIDLDSLQNLKDIEASKEEHLNNLRLLLETQLSGTVSYEQFCEMISKITMYEDKVEILLYFMEDMGFVINRSLVFITNTNKKTYYEDTRIKR